MFDQPLLPAEDKASFIKRFIAGASEMFSLLLQFATGAANIEMKGEAR